jgi:hypothetical protein
MTHYLDKMRIYDVIPSYFVVSKTAYDRYGDAIREYNNNRYLGDIIYDYHVSLEEIMEMKHLTSFELENIFCPRAKKKICKWSIRDLPPERYDLGLVATAKLGYCFTYGKPGLNKAVSDEIAGRNAKARESENRKRSEAMLAAALKAAEQAKAEELRKLERESKSWLFPELANSIHCHNMD